MIGLVILVAQKLHFLDVFKHFIFVLLFWDTLYIHVEKELLKVSIPHWSIRSQLELRLAHKNAACFLALPWKGNTKKNIF